MHGALVPVARTRGHPARRRLPRPIAVPHPRGVASVGRTSQPSFSSNSLPWLSNAARTNANARKHDARIGSYWPPKSQP